MNKVSDLAPITREEAYKAIRLLILRMDATAKGDPKPATAQEAADQLNWTFAIDRLFVALDCVK